MMFRIKRRSGKEEKFGVLLMLPSSGLVHKKYHLTTAQQAATVCIFLFWEGGTTNKNLSTKKRKKKQQNSVLKCCWDTKRGLARRDDTYAAPTFHCPISAYHLWRLRGLMQSTYIFLSARVLSSTEGAGAAVQAAPPASLVQGSILSTVYITCSVAVYVYVRLFATRESWIVHSSKNI
jgi:hypothetical protein